MYFYLKIVFLLFKKSIDYDDSNGYACNQGKFPLLNKVYDVLWNETTICTTTTKPTTTTSHVYNRTKLITPSWKKTTKYYLKDFRSRLGKNSAFSSAFNNNNKSAIVIICYMLINFFLVIF